MIKYNACRLSNLIEETYGHEFNVPYMIMMDQRLIKTYVDNVAVEDRSLIEDFVKRGCDSCNNAEELFQDLLDDLCHKGLLEEGEYLIKFDD